MSNRIINKPNWNENEFIAFVLLYCAHADMDYDKREQDMIKDLVSEEHYQAVSTFFDQCNDAECLQVISSFKGIYYPTLEQKEALMDKINKLFKVDNIYNEMEHAVAHSLRRIL